MPAPRSHFICLLTFPQSQASGKFSPSCLHLLTSLSPLHPIQSGFLLPTVFFVTALNTQCSLATGPLGSSVWLCSCWVGVTPTFLVSGALAPSPTKRGAILGSVLGPLPCCPLGRTWSPTGLCSSALSTELECSAAWGGHHVGIPKAPPPSSHGPQQNSASWDPNLSKRHCALLVQPGTWVSPSSPYPFPQPLNHQLQPTWPPEQLYKTFQIEIVLVLQKTCISSTERSCMPNTQLILKLTSSIIMMQLAKPGN